MNKFSVFPFRRIVVAIVTSFCLLGESSAAGFDDSVPAHIGYPGWFNESPFSDLTEDLNDARSSGKKGLMVLFTTEGCSYCDLFIRKSLGNEEIAAAVQKTLHQLEWKYSMIPK